jgi:hypothetical protein
MCSRRLRRAVQGADVVVAQCEKTSSSWRSRYWQQLEKLLEDAAIKVSAAGDSTRSQGRDVVVAGSAGFVDKPFAPQLARS